MKFFFGLSATTLHIQESRPRHLQKKTQPEKQTPNPTRPQLLLPEYITTTHKIRVFKTFVSLKEQEILTRLAQ